MPAFVYGGNQGLAGLDTELYRIYVFTDRDCLNRVFTGAITGGPAYAPRSFGPLTLPKSTGALAAARSTYLTDGDQGSTYMADFESVTPNESLPQPSLTTTLPSAAPTDSDDAHDADHADALRSKSREPARSRSAETAAPPSTSGTRTGRRAATTGPSSPSRRSTRRRSRRPPSSRPRSARCRSRSPTRDGFSTGDVVDIGNPSNKETVTVTGVTGNTISLATALKQAHGAGEPVLRMTGNLIYRDLELPQEVCASGRVMRFGKSSEPTLVTGGAPFASGLSPKGRLISAAGVGASFYGTPLVAWTPALGADAYHVQWSKKRYPFNAELSNGTAGFLTLSTSAVLPLKPGTWWYRVRGISWRLPQNAQYMSWSDPTRIVAARPTFAIKP